MNLLLTALTAALLAWYFINVARIPERFKILYRKPFNCTTCLSFWTGLVLLFTPEKIVQGLFVCILAACIGIWLEK